MEFGPEVLVAAPVAVFIAYFMFGMTGFGSSIIAVPLLAHFFPIQVAVPLMAVLDFSASLLLGGKTRRHVSGTEMKWLIPFAVLGIVIGVTLLIRLPAQPLLVGLGLFVLVYGAYSIAEPSFRGVVSRSWAVPAGLVGGTFTALFGTGGVVYAIYLSRRLPDKFELRATMSAVIIISSTLRIAFFLLGGLLLQLKVLGPALALMPVMVIAIKSGTRVHVGMSQRHMRQALGCLLVVSGASLLWKALA